MCPTFKQAIKFCLSPKKIMYLGKLSNLPTHLRTYLRTYVPMYLRTYELKLSMYQQCTYIPKISMYILNYVLT
jgi:hypothetical protein